MENNKLQREIAQQRLTIGSLENQGKFYEMRMAEVKREKEAAGEARRGKRVVEEQLRAKTEQLEASMMELNSK